MPRRRRDGGPGGPVLEMTLRILAVVLMIFGALLVGRGVALVLQAPLVPLSFGIALRAGAAETALGAGLGWLGWVMAGRLGRGGSEPS